MSDLIAWQWHDWDGSTQWWNQVREVSLRPYQDWDSFRSNCVERLHVTPHAVLKDLANGSILVFFCDEARTSRSIRKCPRNRLPMWAAPYVCLCGPAQCLAVSFEESLDSPRRKEFVLWCLQQMGRCSVYIDP
jgi:hypothetical protein